MCTLTNISREDINWLSLCSSHWEYWGPRKLTATSFSRFCLSDKLSEEQMRSTEIKKKDKNWRKMTCKILQEYKQKDEIKTISQLGWLLPYLLTVRDTVAGPMRTRGCSQDTEMDTGSIFSGFSSNSDIDLHWHKLLPSSAPLQSHKVRSIFTLDR